MKKIQIELDINNSEKYIIKAIQNNMIYKKNRKQLNY